MGKDLSNAIENSSLQAEQETVVKETVSGAKPVGTFMWFYL